MKKILLSILVVLIVAVALFTMVACKETSEPTAANSVVLAEAGSAGEDLAKEFVKNHPGSTYVEAQAQRSIFTELIAYTADIGFIDSIMANYYINETGSTFSGKLQVVDIGAEAETYAIGFRKADVYLTQKVNKALYDLQQEGKIAEIATTYGLTSELIAFEDQIVDETLDKTSYNSIINRGTMIVGYTIFAPIAYTKDGAFVGFDTDVAKAVCQKLGVTAVFQEIDWDEKELELNGYTIDAIWNGMTYTEERAEAMSMSNSYLRNKQVAVVRKGEASRVN